MSTKWWEKLVPFPCLVADAVKSNQCIRQIHTTHVAIVVLDAVRYWYGLDLPPPSLLHLSPHCLSTVCMMHCGAHRYLSRVHPLYKEEFAPLDPYPYKRMSPLWAFLDRLLVCFWVNTIFPTTANVLFGPIRIDLISVQCIAATKERKRQKVHHCWVTQTVACGGLTFACVPKKIQV